MQNETVPGTQYELYTRLLIETSAICPLDALCPLFSQTAGTLVEHSANQSNQFYLSAQTCLVYPYLTHVFLCNAHYGEHWCLIRCPRHGRLDQYLMSKQMDRGNKGAETDILRSKDLNGAFRDKRKAAFLPKERGPWRLDGWNNRSKASGA